MCRNEKQREARLGRSELHDEERGSGGQAESASAIFRRGCDTGEHKRAVQRGQRQSVLAQGIWVIDERVPRPEQREHPSKLGGH
jgi:hypothetical protein